MKEIKLLVIDSDEGAQKNYKKLLASYKGARVIHIEALSAKEGLTFYHAYDPDVVLLQHMLPDMNSTEFLVALYKPDDDFTPIILLTTNEPISVIEKTGRQGVADHLHKDDLVGRVLEKTISGALKRAELEHKVYKQTQEMQRQTRCDALTGLMNRRTFEEQAKMRLIKAHKDKEIVAVLYLDLDNFKEVNDRLGYEAGDEILQQVAFRVHGSLRENDLIARFGGDEFVVLICDLERSLDASRVAKKIIDEIEDVFYYKKEKVKIGVSVGIACFLQEEPLVQLIRKADIALYRSKSAGKGTFHYYSEELNYVNKQRLSIEFELDRAIKEEEFFLLYQPKFSVKDKCAKGLEALIRWQHPRQGVILPEEFIPISELSGQILYLGNWVIETALTQFAIWDEESKIDKDVTLSINLSAVQLKNDEFIKSLERIANNRKFKHLLRRVEFELIEGTFVKHYKKLNRLQDLTFQVAIDNFGTGYSSLKEISEFPVNCLKVDKSFVHRIGVNEQSESVIRSIIHLGSELGVKVVAEGCETKKQLVFLEKEKCTHVQGFYFSKPLSALEMTLQLEQHMQHVYQ